METLSEHIIEPALAAPPPRRRSLPPRLVLLMTLAILMMSLFALGGVRAVWEAGKLGWLAGAGRTVPGTVTQIVTQPAPEKAAPPVPLGLWYTVPLTGPHGPLQRRGWISLAGEPTLPGGPARALPAPVPAVHIGQTLPVRYAPWFGGVLSQPWAAAPGSRIATLLFIGVLVLLVTASLGRRLLHWLRGYLHLLQHGQATVGTITDKRTEAEDAARYFLTYGYSAAGEGLEREEQVGAEQWKLFQVGQPVTVLFDPAQPAHAGLYVLMA